MARDFITAVEKLKRSQKSKQLTPTKKYFLKPNLKKSKNLVCCRLNIKLVVRYTYTKTVFKQS